MIHIPSIRPRFNVFYVSDIFAVMCSRHSERRPIVEVHTIVGMIQGVDLSWQRNRVWERGNQHSP